MNDTFQNLDEQLDKALVYIQDEIEKIAFANKEDVQEIYIKTSVVFNLKLNFLIEEFKYYCQNKRRLKNAKN